MDKRDKIENLVQLGLVFKDAVQLWKHEKEQFESQVSKALIHEGVDAINVAKQHNSWFTDSSIQLAFEAWSSSLQTSKIEKWLSPFDFKEIPSQKVGVIMAGNIPLVGLHDVLCVLISDQKLHAKPSSKDRILINWVLKVLSEISSEWANSIELKEQLKEIDVLIATGSNNSARYFEYYFKKQRKIIRKNRSSIAVLNGNETNDELEALAKDIFTHFGMGCRNITKVYLPKGFELSRLFQAFFSYKDLIQHNQYANNYDYNKAVYLMNKIPLMENGFLLLKEDEGIHSPLAVLFYEYYEDLNELLEKLETLDDEIQCKVGKLDHPEFIPFGKAQEPELWDYADGVNTLEFLLNSSKN